MGTAKRNLERKLDVASVRAVYRAVYDAAECGDDALKWRKQLITTIGRVISADIAFSIVVSAPENNGNTRPRIEFACQMQRVNDDKPQLTVLETSPELADCPVLLKAFSRIDKITTRFRPDICANGHSPFGCFLGLCEKQGISDLIYSQCPVPNREATAVAFVFVRCGRKDLFAERDRRLVDLMNKELNYCWTRNSVTHAQMMKELSPRQQQMLRMLLGPHSEKQMSKEANLSRNTIHNYVKALYRRLKVSSRPELTCKYRHLSSETRPRILP